MRAQSISEPPSNDRRSVEPGLYMLLKCQKAAVRRKLRDRNPDLFSAFEILDHTGEAADGREAIEKAQRLKPDLIVLDLSMPVMNGLEAARELQRLLPSLPSPQLSREVLSAGVSALGAHNANQLAGAS
jgi:CheY-like chemotaxis protein